MRRAKRVHRPAVLFSVGNQRADADDRKRGPPLANSGRKFRPELPIIAAEKVYAAGISRA
jgi:hypothetical protein